MRKSSGLILAATLQVMRTLQARVEGVQRPQDDALTLNQFIVSNRCTAPQQRIALQQPIAPQQPIASHDPAILAAIINCHSEMESPLTPLH
jgi:hypothetical protein